VAGQKTPLARGLERTGGVFLQGEVGVETGGGGMGFRGVVARKGKRLGAASRGQGGVKGDVKIIPQGNR